MNEDKIDLSKAFLDSFQDKISSFRRGDNNGLISLHDSLSTIVMQITSEIMLKYSNMFNEKSIDLLRKYPEDLQFPNEIRKSHPKKR